VIRALVLAVVLAALASTAAPALAHEYWLAPSRWTARPKETVSFGAAVGTGFRGESRPFVASRCVRLVAQADTTIDLATQATPDALSWARLTPRDAGGMMLAFESNFAPIEIAAAEFDAYLALEGLDHPLAERRRTATAAPGRERYRRCAKAWIDGSDAGRARRPIGLPLEIVPLERPGATPALGVRVLFGGRPLAGALVRAWRTALAPGDRGINPAMRDSVGPAWEGRTDANGEASVPVAEAGEWLVNAVHMVPCPDPAQADWESTWASLTFARPATKRDDPRASGSRQ